MRIYISIACLKLHQRIHWRFYRIESRSPHVCVCVYTFVHVHVQSRDTDSYACSYVAKRLRSQQQTTTTTTSTTPHRTTTTSIESFNIYTNMSYIRKTWRLANPAVICAISNKSVHLFALTFNRAGGTRSGGHNRICARSTVKNGARHT